MGIKDLFGNNILGKPISDSSIESLSREVESDEHIKNRIAEKNRFIPHVEYEKPESFAKYGSAEKYYDSSIKRIYEQYPYDGSKAEVKQFLNESSYLDLYLLDKRYPRTNGFINLGLTSMVHANKVEGWGYTSTTDEYIEVLGGPHTSSGGMIGNPLSDAFGDPTYRTSPNANIYDTDVYTTANTLAEERVGSRESNLKFNLTDGLTVEFWLKKEAFISAQTEKEVIFDLWNGTVSGSEASEYDDYGRLLVYLDQSATSNNSIKFHLASGSTVWDGAMGGTDFASTHFVDSTPGWYHYALSFASSSADNQLQAKLYVTGTLVQTATADTGTFGEVTGSLKARIGALQYAPSGNSFHEQRANFAGSSKLSASLDEFRFWKTKRTSEEIGRNWFTQVGAGSNNDISNAELGFYFKFNEGIVGDTTTDSTVLDYSGRISNGIWTGYPGITARDIGSAMVYGSASLSEFKDPIIYSEHADVKALVTELASSGSWYDSQNPASLYHSLPSFMPEEDENSQLFELTQIVSSYLDTLHLQTEALPRLKDAYFISSSFKPVPFTNRFLDSHGFETSEIFANAGILSQIANRDETRDFELDLHDVKNRIYHNIYNTLVYLYKTKGTEGAFRNLIRAFGVDEELIKINMYGNNITHTINDNVKFVASRTKAINFNDPDHYSATVVQWSGSSATYGLDTISMSGTAVNGLLHKARTAEVQAIFPRKLPRSHPEWFATSFLTSSIFGTHLPATADLVGEKIQNITAANSTNDFYLYALRPEKESKDARFILKTSDGTTLAATVLYKDVYDNQKWVFGVRTRSKHYDHPIHHEPLTGTFGETGTEIEFYGVNTDQDVVRNEFYLKSTHADSDLCMGRRRYFAGAKRTNYTGSVVYQSDVKLLSLRHWESYVDNESIKAHAMDPLNYGTKNPARPTHFFSTSSLSQVHVPEMETLTLHWDFENVTGSDNLGNFFVDDKSWSPDKATTYPSYLGETISNHYAGLGYGFPASTTASFDTNYLATARLQPPEVMNSVDMITIADRDDNKFTRESRPINYFFAFEKSMYRTISEEMLKMFSAIVEFSNLFGRPVDRYRIEYKDMRKLRNLFFERVGNTPDLEKYVSYYKWLDGALGQMLQQLVPASADASDGLRTMVESHELDRAKYRHKFPNLKHVEPDFTGHIYGIEEHLYDWEYGHAPVTIDENTNTLWWKDRTERSHTEFNTPDTIDGQREIYRQTAPAHISGTGPIHAQSDKTEYTGSAYALRNFTKIYRFDVSVESPIHGGSNYGLTKPGISNKRFDAVNATLDYDTKHIQVLSIEERSASIEAVNDNPTPRALRKVQKYPDAVILDHEDATEYGFYHTKASLVTPFTMYSSSVTTGYQGELGRMGHSIDLTNMHSDVYGTEYEVPMQGPFTERFVGGSQHRHVDLNRVSALTDYDTAHTADTDATRPEKWNLDFDKAAGTFNISARHTTGMSTAVGIPRARYYRDEVAKRPVNIRNIKMWTSASTNTVSGTLRASIGNFTRDYEIVQTSDRSVNNRAFTRAEGFSTTSVTEEAAALVEGLVDYAKPVRERTEHVFVERFSAPGGPETAGDHNGGPGLDVASGQFSPYNDMNSRNSTVRQPLNTLHTERSEYGGARSGSAVNYKDIGAAYTAGDWFPSFHKVNRNRLKRLELNTYKDLADATIATDVITGSSYDNFFIQHSIPRSDTQYSWITASLVSAAELGAVARLDGLYKNKDGVLDASIKFVTGSVAGRRGPTETVAQNYDYLDNFGHYVDTVGLNKFIYEPVSASVARLGYSLDVRDVAYMHPELGNNEGTGPQGLPTSSMLNTLMLHRGNRGYPSWRQIRVGENPIVRNWRKNNLYVINTSQQGATLAVHESPYYSYVRHGDTLVSYTEPPVITMHDPNQYDLGVLAAGQVTSMDIMGSYGNYLDYFANPDLQDEVIGCRVDISTDTDCPPVHTKLSYQYKGSDSTAAGISTAYAAASNTIINEAQMRMSWDAADAAMKDYDRQRPQLNSLRIGQCVWPRAQHAFLSKHRKRNEYSNNFWRSSRPDRASTTKWVDVWNSATTVVGTYSKWNLDANTRWATATPANQTGINDDSGILQNNRTHCGTALNPAAPKHITGSILYSLKLTCPNTGAIRGTSVELLQTLVNAPDASGTYCSPTLGSAKWEAPTQAGYWSSDGTWTASPAEPWDDTYDDYADQLRLLNKSYSIIPEFRISDHVENIILNHGGNFLNPKAYEESGTFRIAQALATETIPSSSQNETFYKTFANSEFMRHFERIREEHEDIADPSAISLKCDAIMKFVPYDGFYPSELLGELWERFSGSYFDHVHTRSPSFAPATYPNAAGTHRPLTTPMFGPGIWNNTIKSGIAVSFPVYSASFHPHVPHNSDSGSMEHHLLQLSRNPRLDAAGAPAGWDYVVPFEATVQPEQYLANEHLVDIFPHPSASLNLTSSWSGEGDPLYKMKAHNALYSMIDFFLPGKDNHGELTTITSVPEKEFGSFEKNKYYGMRVTLRKSYNRDRQAGNRFLRGYVTPHDTLTDYANGLRETTTMYSTPFSFGPPVAGRYGFDITEEVPFSNPVLPDSLMGVNPGFTPPYYNGQAWADIIYHHTSDYQPTLTDVITGSTVYQWRFDPLHVGSGDNAMPYGKDRINDFSMQVTDSINLFGVVKVKSVEHTPEGSQTKIFDDTSERSDVWAIQPKMETPILNFQEFSPARTFPTVCSESSPTGMWHQFGRIPKSKETGIFLDVGDIPPSWLQKRVPLFASSSGDDGAAHADGYQVGSMWYDGTANKSAFGKDYSSFVTSYNSGEVESLADKIKIDSRTERLGELAQKRTVKEAIVAVPYIQLKNRRKFFKIPKRQVNGAQRLLSGRPTQTIVGNSVLDQLTKMEDYVFPPTMDFLQYPEEVEAVAMYIFEFSHTFDQNDLSYIWQNLRPPSGNKIQTATSTLGHRLLTHELMGERASKTGKPIQDRLRWMVFKVKQSAGTNYYQKVVANKKFSDSKFQSSYKIGRSDVQRSKDTNLADYSYNWPYDQFSLVEFAKIGASVTYSNDFTADEEELRPKTKLKRSKVAQASFIEERATTDISRELAYGSGDKNLPASGAKNLLAADSGLISKEMATIPPSVFGGGSTKGKIPPSKSKTAGQVASNPRTTSEGRSRNTPGTRAKKGTY
tara:strand:+ start:3188 stop:12661 length:9474 start_codon:yes stop_codon:yes gene_type:complete